MCGDAKETMKVRTLSPKAFTILFLLGLISLHVSGGVALSFKIYGDVDYIENKGQWDDRVRFKAEVHGGQMFVEQNRITYRLFDQKLIKAQTGIAHGGEGAPRDRMRSHTYRVYFPGSNIHAQLVRNGKQRHHHNYFLGSDRSKWASNVPIFKEITYQNLFPGIDLDLYSVGDQLKYDVRIAKGVDPARFRMRYEDVDKLELVHGQLVVHTSVGRVEELTPYAFQVKNGERREIECQFVLQGDLVSFAFPEGYDKKLPIVIDPAIIFASFTGSTTDNFGFTATYDKHGNLYAGGIALSPGSGYPTTGGAYDGSWNGGVDVGITVFDDTGATLLYSTFLGGSADETPHSLFVNDQDELYIFGLTGSNNFPFVSGCYDSTFAGGTFLSLPSNGVTFAAGTDIFVSKLNAAGSVLMGSTYIGGSLNDGLNQSAQLRYNYADQFRGEIIVDNVGNAYVASTTLSTNFPVSGSAVQDSLKAGQDAVVFKFNGALTTLAWSTYWGGSGDDAAYSLILDKQKNVYFAGGTSSTDFYTTSNAMDTSYLGGRCDGFIAHLEFDGSSIFNSTLNGTSGYDQNYFVQGDKENQIYVVGQTDGAYENDTSKYNNPNSGQYIHKIDSTLSSSIYALTFGSGDGTPDISPTAFLVDTCFNIYVSGWGGTTNNPPLGNGGNTIGLPTSFDAYDSTTDGSDQYLFVLPKGAEYLSYGSFYGSPVSAEHVDGGTSRFDKDGFVYQSICGGCGSNDDTAITTPGVWSRRNASGNCNLLAIKFQFDLSGINANLVANPPNGCHPLTVNFTNTSLGGVEYYWNFGDSLSLNNTSRAFDTGHVYEQPGIYDVQLIIVDSASCNVVDTAVAQIQVFPPPDADAGPDLEVDIGNSVTLLGATTLGGSWFWSPGQFLDDSTAIQPNADVTQRTRFILTVVSPEGCISYDTMWVDVIPSLTIPNAFSPNGDGVNEKIFVIPAGIVSLLEFRIFNRWGDLVFETSDINEGWDGIYNGEEQELGTYVYYVKAILDEDEPPVLLKGNITLIR
jgi:gliding motility-associated-like protein